MLGLQAQYSLTQMGVLAAVSPAGLRHIYGVAGTLENNLRLGIPLESIVETLAPQIEQLEWDEAGKQPQLFHQNRMLTRILSGTHYPDTKDRRTDAHVVVGSIYHTIDRINPELFRDLSGFAGKLSLPPPTMPSGARATGYLRSLHPTSSMPPVRRDGELECPHCQSKNPENKSFCGDCGEYIADDMQFVQRAENMRGTILFTDFKGFTDMSQAMPAESLFRWLNHQFNILGAEIMKQGGWFVKNIGDAIMVVFNRHEDHARRGVSAALNMLQILERINPELEAMGLPALEMRIGVHTGDIAVGFLGGPGSKRPDVIGKAVNLASRLESFKQDAGTEKQSLPEGNRVLISDATMSELAGGYESDSLGEIAFKGFNEKVVVHHVTREEPIAAISDRFGGVRTRFRGRDEEMNRLQQTVASSLEGDPKFALVLGEAGEGKSRLVLELIDSLGEFTDKDIKVMRAKGIDRDYHPPYALMSEALSHLAGIEEDDSVEIVEVKLRSLLWISEDVNASDQEQTAQLLGRLLGLSFRTEFHPQERLGRETIDLRHRINDNIDAMSSDEKVLRQAIHRAVIQFFKDYSRHFPLLFSLEDLHWADKESLDLFHEIFSHLKGSPVMAIATARPKFEKDNPISFEPQSSGHRYQIGEFFKGDYVAAPIGLTDLSQADMRSIVQDILKNTEHNQHEVINFVIGQAGGNVFLLHEFAHAVREGWLQQGESVDEWKFVSGDGSRPVGVDNFFQVRLGRLEAGERTIVDYAAVIGSTFDLADLQELQVQEAGKHLGALVRKNILFQLRDGRYRFCHDMMREKTYEMMNEVTLHELHGDLAVLLIDRKDDDVVLIAHHLERAGRGIEAAAFYIKAAEQAHERALYQQALDYYQRVFKLSGQADAELALKALIGGNEVALDMRDTESAYARIEFADNYIMSTSDRELKARYVYRLAHTLQVDRNEDIKADLQAAEGVVLDALKWYRDGEVTEMKVRLLATMGRICAEGRKFGTGQPYIAEAIRLAKILKDDDVLAETYLHQMYMDLQYGNYGSVIKLGRDVDALLKSPKFANRRIKRNVNVGGAYINLGDYEEALRIYEATEKLSIDQFAETYLVNIVPNIGTCLRLLGRHEEALQQLDRAVELFSDHPHEFMAGVTHLYRSLTLLELKRYDDALSAAQQVYAISQAGKESDPKLEAMAHMAEAQVNLAKGDPKRAEHSSKRAYDLLLAANWSIEEFDLEIALTHARVLWKQGKTEEAWHVLDGTQTIRGAKAELLERAKKLEQSHQDSFSHRNRVNAAIIQMWEALQQERTRSDSQENLAMIVQEAISKLRPGAFDDEVKSYEAGELGQVSEVRERGNYESAGVVLRYPYIVTLSSLLSKGREIEARETREPGIMMPKTSWRPDFDDGEPSVQLDFDLEASDPQILSALNTFGNVKRHIHVRYIGKHSYHGGVLRITLELSPDEQQFTADQFGEIEVSIGACADGRSILAVRIEKSAFNTRPDIIVKALAAGLS